MPTWAVCLRAQVVFRLCAKISKHSTRDSHNMKDPSDVICYIHRNNNIQNLIARSTMAKLPQEGQYSEERKDQEAFTTGPISMPGNRFP